jgi:hypothetical protein
MQGTLISAIANLKAQECEDEVVVPHKEALVDKPQVLSQHRLGWLGSLT